MTPGVKDTADFVSELRRLADDGLSTRTPGAETLVCHMAFALRAAADEIERLQCDLYEMTSARHQARNEAIDLTKERDEARSRVESLGDRLATCIEALKWYAHTPYFEVMHDDGERARAILRELGQQIGVDGE